MSKNVEKQEPPQKEDPEEQDVITVLIGDYGRWQLQMTCILAFFNLPCTWHIFCPTFHAQELEVWCARPLDLPNVDPFLWKNVSQSDDYCKIVDYKSVNYTMDDISQISQLSKNNSVSCDRWEFNGEGETIITEFNLFCDRKWITNLSEMVFLGGVALGGIISGWFSDKYGRKKTLLASVSLQTIIGTCIAFVPYIELYITLRTLLGFVSVSVVFSGFVLAIELVDGKWRTVAGVCYLMPLPVGYASIAGMAYLLRDWRHLQMAISLPGILFISICFILPESPRWLLAMGKSSHLSKVIHKACLVNDRQCPENLEKLLQPISTEHSESVQILDLFRNPKIRRITLCLQVIWFVVYLVYYGLVLNVGNIGGDLYVNAVLSGLVELPADIISLLFLLKLGRRWPFFATVIVAGVPCFIIIFVPAVLQWLITSLAMFAKFSISASNIIMPVYTAELYPTTIRNIGVGASNVPAGIALMLVPYLWNLASIKIWLPWAILGISGIVGAFCVLLLPETGHGKLKNTLDEEDEGIPQRERESSISHRISIVSAVSRQISENLE